MTKVEDAVNEPQFASRNPRFNHVAMSLPPETVVPPESPGTVCDTLFRSTWTRFEL